MLIFDQSIAGRANGAQVAPAPAPDDLPAGLLRTSPPPLPVDELAEAIQFLQWLLADNFTLIGVRSYDCDGHALVPRFETGLGIMRERDLRVLPESAPGLNAALHGAIATLAGEAIDTLLVLPADVPLLDAATLAQIRVAHRTAPALTLVAASADGGTNALLMSPPALLSPAFGAGSCAGYCRAAVELGVAPTLLDLPQAALDIDRPEDLARLEFQTGATRTREFLHRIDAWARLRHGASESPVTLARHAS